MTNQINIKKKKVFNIKDIGFYGIFVIMFMWDIIEWYMPNTQFMFLLIFFIIDLLFKKKFNISKLFLVLDLAMLIHGVITILLGTNTIPLFIKQYGAINVCFVSYSNMIDTHSNKEIFDLYFYSCVLMAIFGYVEVFAAIFLPEVTSLPWTAIGSNMGVAITRRSSLTYEPSFLAYYLMPAITLYVFGLVDKDLIEKDYFKHRHIMSWLIIIMFILSESGTGYVGLGVMFILLIIKTKPFIKKAIVVIGLVVALSLGYLCFGEVRERVIKTMDALIDSNNEATIEGSVYTLYKTFKIDEMTFIDTKGLGSGLGSFVNMHEKYMPILKQTDIYTIRLLELGYRDDNCFNICYDDGDSMFIRITTECGVLGLIAIIWFIGKYTVKGRNKYVGYSCACLVLFMMLLLRMGNYMHAGTIMFVCFFIKLYKESKGINLEDKCFILCIENNKLVFKNN